MLRSMQRPKHGRKPSFASLWKACYTWRWSKPFPIPTKDRRWWINSARTFKTLKEVEGFTDIGLKAFLYWFWAWKSFDMTEQQTLRPAFLRNYIEQYKKWLQQYSYAIDQHQGILAVCHYYYPHESRYIPPWDLEDVE
jgi:hypothetical protein